MTWAKTFRRVFLLLLAATLALQWLAPESYLADYDALHTTLTRPWNRRAAQLERQQSRERALVAAGYEYGLAVARFYGEARIRQETPANMKRRDVCQQMSFADRDLGEAGADPDYFNAKLRGMADVRRACEQEQILEAGNR